MARTTAQTPSLDQIVAAVVAAMQGGETPTKAKPAAKRPTRSSGAKATPAPRRVKPENLDRAASGKAVQGAFFEAFQVIYGERLTGWPTLGDIQAIRDDLQARIAAQ